MSVEPMQAIVLSREFLSPSMIRVRLGGDELRHFESCGVPDEFIWLSFPKPDGSMGGRYYTVRHWEQDTRCLTVDFVRHDVGIGTDWACNASAGDRIEIYLPRSRFSPPAKGSILLLGDFSALPAIARIIEEVSPDRLVVAHVEVPTLQDRLDLRSGENINIFWHETFGAANRATSLPDIVRTAIPSGDLGYVWIAGEAKAVAECRMHVRDAWRIAKDSITAVGYWVEGQARG
ncbi:siderophore-interacting protein [Rhizobium wenxiniae]|uniref:siderophore-interacting protein n=1 Tax=Rhizobium wenxiniae TaxID=1737357 RepID=UPI003C249F94